MYIHMYKHEMQVMMIPYHIVSVTPLDVVKTRLQAQQKRLLSNKCYVYCNGLMDHLCPCEPGMTSANAKKIHFNGTLVKL